MQAAEAGYFRSGGRGLCGQSASAGHLGAPLRDGRLVDQTGPDIRPTHRHLAAVCLHRYGYNPDPYWEACQMALFHMRLRVSAFMRLYDKFIISSANWL